MLLPVSNEESLFSYINGGVFLEDTNSRFDKIEPKIKEDNFLKNKGMGNEVGYYIFDYPPEDELIVRQRIHDLKEKINSNDYGFKILEFDLYEMIIQILDSKGYLEKTFKFEKDKGRDFTRNAIDKVLKLSLDSNLIVNNIIENSDSDSVIFITGVGKVYPFVRSHNILNNLHQQLDDIPVILFFPGQYTGTDLKLFNTLESSNYYRAFKLVY